MHKYEVTSFSMRLRSNSVVGKVEGSKQERDSVLLFIAAFFVHNERNEAES